MPIRLALFSILLPLSLTAQAAIYKIIDENGRTTYTDRLPHGVKPALVIQDLKPAASSAPSGKADKSDRPRRSAAPMHFPKVDSGTQQKRDDARRDLLREELATEQRELASARSAQAAARTADERRQLAESVGLHEKNIEMLNKELARLR
jgi:hypothetical protein